MVLRPRFHTTPSKPIEVEENLEARAKAGVDPPVVLETVSTVASPIIEEIAQLLVKSARSVGKKTTLRPFAKVVVQTRDHSRQRPKKGKGKRFHEINESGEGVMDDLTEQVQSLFYNDVHFNSVNARMHTTLKCETPDGRSSDQVFKIDTGADGNLMPISMFAKLFPKGSLDALNKMINRSVTLFAYNYTEIKQFGTCSIKLNFQGRSLVCKFSVVEHETVIVIITDSEILVSSV